LRHRNDPALLPLPDRRRRFAGSPTPLCQIADAALPDRRRRFAGSPNGALPDPPTLLRR
jgi:hypothetical protein